MGFQLGRQAGLGRTGQAWARKDKNGQERA